ncbi:MAG: four helix bundle protein [bacterium]
MRNGKTSSAIRNRFYEYPMNSQDLKQRTKSFALRIIKLVESLPRERVSDVLGKQILRSGTSVGSNYRAACRAKSPADFVFKLGIVEEELDETIFWLELLVDSKILKFNLVETLIKEANELLAIMITSIKTTRSNRITRKSAIRNPKSTI